ncbi:hypothetical protein CPLU01_00161 [Colletotrichum plurivorum]|uniref:Uncharacterized protein n=1 Tax=Colletotrichum plurivorum TaxID=2175906 RepID=A0A8H6U657_9PEZI|nr:hypothetical protein CPLU01_00161 [Colletotrichum plurivorum]
MQRCSFFAASFPNPISNGSIPLVLSLYGLIESVASFTVPAYQENELTLPPQNGCDGIPAKPAPSQCPPADVRVRGATGSRNATEISASAVSQSAEATGAGTQAQVNNCLLRQNLQDELAPGPACLWRAAAIVILSASLSFGPSLDAGSIAQAFGKTFSVASSRTSVSPEKKRGKLLNLPRDI